MSFKFSDIEDAYLFVSMGPEFSNQAILCKKTGKIYYASEYGDENEIPEDVYENDECIEISGKNTLDLETNLVFEFAEKNLPEMYEQVRQIFRKKGAYARYKDLLDEKGLLQRWYDFENDRQTQALKEWCADNKIELDG